MKATKAMRMSALALLLVVAGVGKADARPTYFDVLTETYSIAEGSRLHTCAVCHFKWDGTGPRNPFGNAVQQQLYIGKSIHSSLADVETLDSDGDGFSNVSEIIDHLTLPGYSCLNYFEAMGAPQGFDGYATPGVVSCLEPLDVRISLPSVTMIADAGSTVARELVIYNNGSEHPLTVPSYGLVAGSSEMFSVAGPTAPFDIAVGENVTLVVSFSPPSAAFENGLLRIETNDPDAEEASIDIDLAGVGVLHVLAPAVQRQDCLGSVAKRFGRYGKGHLREWGRCYVDAVWGQACSQGLREVRLARAEEKLARSVGGRGDRRCAPDGLTPSLLGLGGDCGGGCQAIEMGSLEDLVDCLVCRQEEATAELFEAASGFNPPDLPQPATTTAAAACQARLLKGVAKSSLVALKVLARCEAANVTAAETVDCSQALTTKLEKLRARAVAQFDKCADTTGLSGCSFPTAAELEEDPAQPPDPTCLGVASLDVATELRDLLFGLGD